MQHVASKSSVQHSHHHGIDARGRAPAGEPKQPTTPFSLLLDGTDDAPPPRPKHQDGTTKTSEPDRTVAAEPSRGDQTQPTEHEPAAKVADAVPATPDETGKTGEKPEEIETGDKPEEIEMTGEKPEETEKTGEKPEATVIATSPQHDEPTTADTTDKTAAASVAAPATPLPAQQAPPAAVVPGLPTTQSVPAEPTDETETDATVDLAKAAAAAGLKADQPAAPKAKTDRKAAPPAAADSQPADPAPAANAGESAEPVEAPKPRGEVHAPPATPDQDKPEHARIHEVASRGDVRGTDALANPQATAPVPDSAPAGKPADGAQPVTVQLQADRTGNAAAPAAPAPNSGPAAVPLAGLAVEIAVRAQGGRNRFEIRLDPPELGRIHVRLDVDKSGQVTSRLVVERAETLDALRRDAADLERALQQAGLKTADNGLQFTLRDQSFAGRDDGFTSASTARLVVPDPDLAPVESAPAGYGRLLRAGGGVDIRV